ncbi:hypothetical protein TNCT_290321 [Trichonephila clavata]|uniref:Uncharacterized protein n=1 Tax=Trichonephila clavata TaxID=2740835 RepID=A0A8X6IK99_TRICU|nr:hypothetical protein TNCT_290321 [Trichonephila clavata]
MRRRAESHSVPDELRLEFFQQPMRTQSILAAISPLALEKAAKVADRVKELLRKFLDITEPPCPDQEIKHVVVYYIETGRPATAKARRLALDRLPNAKTEF